MLRRGNADKKCGKTRAKHKAAGIFPDSGLLLYVAFQRVGDLHRITRWHKEKGPLPFKEKKTKALPLSRKTEEDQIFLENLPYSLSEV